jgi:ATP-dependent Lon protease
MEIAATKIQKVFRRWRLLRLYILSWSNELQNQVSEICFHLNSSNKPCETLIANEEDTTSLPELEIMERDMRMNKSISILENVLEKIVFVVNTFVNTPYSKTKNKIPLLIVLRDLYQAQILIRSVLQSIGGISVKMILEIHLGEDATEYALINSKWVSIMNSKFKPSSYKLFVYDGTKEFLPIESIDNRSTKTSGGGGSGQEIRTLIPSMFSFAKSSSISAEDSLVCDIKHLEMLKSSSKKILAVEDQQHATRIYLHIPSTKERNNISPFYVRLSGTFYYEYFQNFRVLSLPCMTLKFGEMQQILLNSSKLPASYVDKWLKTVTFSDLLCLSTQKLQTRCISLYNLIEKYKSCLVSNIIKEFLSADVSTKRDILTSLYLVDDNSDMLYIGFMLADIVRSDPSYLRQKAQMTDVISTLPWSIRKKINKSVENREIMQTRIINEINSVSGTDAEISYETRIFLMKVPQLVKKKAYDKLKEIQSRSGGGDSQSKAQQYLDGLLRIPFGFYKSEPILSFFPKFRSELMSIIQKYVSFITKSSVTDSSSSSSQPSSSLSPLNTFIQEELTFAVTGSLKLVTFSEIDKIFELLSNEKTSDFTLVAEETSTVIEVFSKDEMIRFLQKKSVDELQLIIQRMKKVLGNVKVLSYYDKIQNSLITVKCKTKTGSTYSTLSSQAISESIASFLAFKEETDQEQYQVLKKEVLPDIILFGGRGKNSRSLSISESFIENHMFSARNHWVQFRKNQQEYLEKMSQSLEKSVYGQIKAKRTISQMIAQWISGSGKGDCFGFEGPPGTGKTSLAKKGLSNCLQDEDGNPRPFAFIALGGSTNGAFLEGHSYTYVGSIWGKIVDVIMESKCMNPIIFFDELDKVSSTEHGKEIISLLTHITDPSQNEEYIDKYFAGIKLDLSKVLFIFSYNDVTRIDPILKDRITSVKFEALSKSDKKVISKLHLLPEIYEVTGVSKNDIVFTEEVVEFIIENYTFEGGARRLKEHLFYIVRELNLRHMTSKRSIFPITITKELLLSDIFKDRALHKDKVIVKNPLVGVINGMYASTVGVGGITCIECFRIPNSNPFALELTGNQGKVMKESMSVSKTVAWNILSFEHQQVLQNDWKKNGSWGLHLHCPEGSVPKDGPSAGTAISICILSCIIQIPIDNTIAITGEIDLNGHVCQIGGLAAKVRGAKAAGVLKVFFPKENEHDLRQILESDDNPFDGNFTYKMVDSIREILPYAFPTIDVYDFICPISFA